MVYTASIVQSQEHHAWYNWEWMGRMFILASGSITTKLMPPVFRYPFFCDMQTIGCFACPARPAEDELEIPLSQKMRLMASRRCVRVTKNVSVGRQCTVKARPEPLIALTFAM